MSEEKKRIADLEQIVDRQNGEIENRIRERHTEVAEKLMEIRSGRERIAELEAKNATLVDMRERWNELVAERDAAYKQGWEKGVKDFAIWRDGEQLVGCLERPLATVLKEGPRPC